MARKGSIDRYRENPINETQEKETEELSPTEKVEIHVQKKTMNDTHYRTSFLMKKELKPRLDRISEYYGRGSRTFLLNEWIEAGIKDAEKAMEKSEEEKLNR